MHPAISIIANLPARDPAIGKDGNVVGFPAANAVMEALQESGFRVIPVAKLDELEKMAKDLLGAISK